VKYKRTLSRLSSVKFPVWVVSIANEFLRAFVRELRRSAPPPGKLQATKKLAVIAVA
jgi:hypothetical protein